MVAAAVALLAPAAVAASAGGITIKLLDASAARKGDPRARIYIDDHLSPGTVIVRHIEVLNGTAVPLPLTFYPDPAVIRDGAFIIVNGRRTSELTRWIRVTPHAATLSPGSHQVLTVRIAVPKSAPSGERYGAILASYIPADKSRIAEGFRIGIRIYLSVGTGPEPVTNFVVDSLTAGRGPRGVPFVQAEVRNTGQRAIDLSGFLTLTHGPAGLTAGPFPTTQGATLAPGQREPVTVRLSRQLPDGPWRARLTLASGDTTREVQATIRFPDAPGTEAKPVAATPVPLLRNKSVVGVVAGILVLLVAVSIFLLLLWRRRRRGGSWPASPPVGPPPPGAIPNPRGQCGTPRPIRRRTGLR